MYNRLFDKTEMDPSTLEVLRHKNYRKMEDDRLRCQKCHGFYWRLWHDMAQCMACQSYTMVELPPVKDITVGIGTFQNMGNLLQVDWIREQLTTKIDIKHAERIKDPLSDRTEFIVYPDRLKCRVTGTETLIEPKITGYWIIGNIPNHAEKVVSSAEALKIVKESKQHNQS